MSRVLGVDYGRRRVGLAISDALGMVANPLEVVASEDAIPAIGSAVAEYGVDLVVVGLPRPLSGGESESTAGARALAGRIRDELGVGVELMDERFTSKMAEEALLSSGMRRRERRERVDKVAAALILQGYLDRAGNSGIDRDVEEST